MISPVALVTLAASAPDVVSSASSTPALAAAVIVAAIGATPGVIAAVVSTRTRREVRDVRHEVTPNGGSSTVDLTHRLLASLVDRMDRLEVKVDEAISTKEEPHR